MKVLAPLPIGFVVFVVHLASMSITGTGINPARSFGAAVMYGRRKAWDDHVCKKVLIQNCVIFCMCVLTPNCVIVAVDFLGWAIVWGSHSSSLSSVHFEGSRSSKSYYWVSEASPPPPLPQRRASSPLECSNVIFE